MIPVIDIETRNFLQIDQNIQKHEEAKSKQVRRVDTNINNNNLRYKNIDKNTQEFRHLQIK